MNADFPFKQDDFQEGMSALEKYNLACDLFMCSTSLQSHDQSLFQLIAAVNTIKEILIVANMIAPDAFQAKLTENLNNIYKMFEEKIKAAQAQEAS